MSAIPGKTRIFYAIAEHLPNSNWLVYCHRCRSQIGTMNSEMFNKAMHSTAGRSGILCPDCREKSCRICGIQKKNMDDDTCGLCFWDDLSSSKEKEPLCLSIVHKSFSVSG